MIRDAITVGLSVLFVTGAAAQVGNPIEALIASRVGTTSISSYPQFADGRLNSCVIEYNAIARDDQYRQGGFLKVYGSFGLMSAKENIAVVLKIVVQDIDTKTMAFTPSAPANSYFVFGTKTSRGQRVDKYPSDTAGGQFTVFQLSPTFEALAADLNRNRTTIAFNRSDGGQDVLIPLDLQVKDTDDSGRKTRSGQMVADFYSCAKDLVDVTSPKPERRSR